MIRPVGIRKKLEPIALHSFEEIPGKKRFIPPDVDPDFILLLFPPVFCNGMAKKD
jgi:hypothetical protein